MREIKGNVLQAMLEPAPSSHRTVPTVNEGLIAPNCFASQKVWHPPTSSATTTILPSVCSEKANKCCLREMCCHFSSVPYSLHFQFCNSFSLLGTGKGVIKTITISFHRRRVLFHVNLQPVWSRFCHGGLFCGTSQRKQLSQNKENLQQHAGSTGGFITLNMRSITN